MAVSLDIRIYSRSRVPAFCDHHRHLRLLILPHECEESIARRNRGSPEVELSKGVECVVFGRKGRSRPTHYYHEEWSFYTTCLL